MFERILSLFQRAQPESEEVRKFRDYLRDGLVATYHEEYKERTELWRNLEAKAQGNVAIAGLVVTGVFAFVKDVSGYALHERVLVACALLFLVGSLISSVIALRVRRAPRAPFGTAGAAGMYQDLMKLGDDEIVESRTAFLEEYTELWSAVNRELTVLNHRKARFVGHAQWLMACAVVTITALTVIRIFVGSPDIALFV